MRYRRGAESQVPTRGQEVKYAIATAVVVLAVWLWVDRERLLLAFFEWMDRLVGSDE
jgi:hypothetical protein